MTRRGSGIRRNILHGVYEDNVRMTGRGTTLAVRSRRRIVSWTGFVALSVIAGIVVFGEKRAFQEIQAKEAAAARTPEQRIEQEFGSPNDPGLNRNVNREVPLASLYGLGVQTIVLDAGHGGKDPGAIGPSNLQEKVVALDVALRLKRRLQDHGYRILLTRETDSTVTLRERAEFANERQADLFVSIHVNAFAVDTVSVIQTFYYSPRGTAETERLAEIENRESGYTIAAWKGSLEQFGKAMKVQESKELAHSIQTVLYRNIQRIRDDVADWGVMRGPFMVLWGVEAPAVLTEISVISHPTDETQLKSSEYREHLAMSLEAGIVHYLESTL